MNKNILSQVSIILVEPAGELNIGSTARIMKNMGLESLILVNPQCDPNSESARLMAVHASDILEEVIVVDSLEKALAGCHRAIATTARSRSVNTPLETPRSTLPWLLAPNLKSALIFGPEERGLSNIELAFAQRFVCIPANPEYPSLNLAQAVAVCAYELYQASEQASLPKSAIVPAAIEQLEGYYQDLQRMLLKIGYLYPHTAESRMEKFRRLYNRNALSSEEVAMLRGIIRQVDWAIDLNRQKPDSHKLRGQKD